MHDVPTYMKKFYFPLFHKKMSATLLSKIYRYKKYTMSETIMSHENILAKTCQQHTKAEMNEKLIVKATNKAANKSYTYKAQNM